MTVLGCDVSFYQDNNYTAKKIDFVKMYNAGIRFVYIRAGQNSWTDEDFLYNWVESKKAGLVRGAYWYLDWRSDHIAQANRFFNLVKSTGDLGELPPVADYEQKVYIPSTGSGTMRLRLKEFLEKIRSLFGKTPIIYTGPYYWKTYGSADVYWKQYPLWIAHYGAISKPSVPLPWDSWKFWQYTDRGDGLKYGVESLQLDMDYFNGSYEDFLAFAGLSLAIPQQAVATPSVEPKIELPVVEVPAPLPPISLPPAPLTLEERISILEEKVNKLNDIIKAF